MKYATTEIPTSNRVSNCHFGIRIPEELREKIQAIADKEFLTSSQVVRRAIRNEVVSKLGNKRPREWSSVVS